MGEVNVLVAGLNNLDISSKPSRYSNNKKKNNKKNGRLNDNRVMVVVSGEKFRHSSIGCYPREMPQFFPMSREVALFHGGKLHNSSEKLLVPQLRSDIAQLAKRSLLESRELKRGYLGVNLYENQEKFDLMDDEELDDAISCFKYMEYWEEQNKKIYGFDRKFVVVSARHHIVDIAMVPFTRQNGNISLTCLFRPGNILSFSRDLNDTSGSETGVNSKDPFFRKICFSGFSLEDVLTEDIGIEKRKPVFSIVENALDDNITLLLRCEMDAYNPITKNYTELKCYSPIKYSNPNHRRKLLKTWIQTGLIPNSDVIIGVRDTQNGDLMDILRFDRASLYKKIANRNLPENKKEWNYNPLVATEWLSYSLKAITLTIQQILDKVGYENTQTFNIKIDTNLNIKVELLASPSLY